MSLRPIALGIAALLAASCSGGGKLTGDGGADTASSDAGGAAASLRDGLLGAWAFDGDGADHSGQGLTLTVDKLSFPAGKFGKGVQFAGTDGSPIAHRNTNDTALDLSSGDFTISFWINFNKTASPQFVAVKGFVQEQGWFVGWAQTEWVFAFPPPTTQSEFADPNDSPATGVFHHVVWERTGDTARMYVDGKLLGGASVKDRTPAAAAPFQVGGFSPGGVAGGQSVVDGVVDDLAIWHRALTDDERTYLATNAVP